jgi:hypothetical protein
VLTGSRPPVPRVSRGQRVPAGHGPGGVPSAAAPGPCRRVRRAGHSNAHRHTVTQAGRPGNRAGGSGFTEASAAESTLTGRLAGPGKLSLKSWIEPELRVTGNADVTVALPASHGQ